MNSFRCCGGRPTEDWQPIQCWAATTTALVLGIVAAASAAAGTGVAVAGAQQQAEAANDTAKYNAKIAENDAIAASQQAEAEAAQIRRKNRLLGGAQRAGYGKAGVDLSGANDVIADAGAQGELEALSALYAGDRAASFNQSRAVSSRLQGSQAVAAGRYSAVGSLIGGIGNTAYALNQPGFRRGGIGRTPANLNYRSPYGQS